jgi:hypothetical protein
MKINRIQELAVPTVRKIQSAMTDVIEHFKTKGYVPTLLERTPNFDSFELVRKSASKTGQTCDLAVYSLKRIGSELPSQELSTFRQLSGSKSYSMSRVEY